jgi:hypothetical protein
MLPENTDTPGDVAPGRASTDPKTIEEPPGRANAVPETIEVAPGRANGLPETKDEPPGLGIGELRRKRSPGRAKLRSTPKNEPPGRAPTPAPTKSSSTPKVGPSGRDELPAPPSTVGAEPNGCSVGVSGPILYEPALYLLAAQLDNAEALRKAVANRLRQATRDPDEEPGEEPRPTRDGLTGRTESGTGLGMAETHPAVRKSVVMLDALETIEHEMELALKRQMRLHPIGPWQAATLGIGEKQLARLLAAIGDPYWNTAADKPRTVSQLWAFCGLHVLPAGGQAAFDTQTSPAASGDPTTAPPPDQTASDAQASAVGVAARRRRGERANWSATAKMRSWLIATKCVIVTRSPYRAVYDAARAKYVEAVHPAACPQCGPAGKPALPGSPLSLGHKHARAVRIVQKAILKDLWLESRRLHQIPGTDQGSPETHVRAVGAGPHSPPHGQVRHDTQRGLAVGGLNSGTDQTSTDAHAAHVGAGSPVPAADQDRVGTHQGFVGGGDDFFEEDELPEAAELNELIDGGAAWVAQRWRTAPGNPGTDQVRDEGP